MGKKSEFVEGLRVTDSETIDIVEMVLGGLVNKEIVALVNSQGGRAVGLSGKDGELIRARKLVLQQADPDAEKEAIDIGHVGEIESVNPEVVETLDEGNFIPVIAPIGVGADGQTYNINADTVAGAIASALSAAKLIMMTDVEGLLAGDGELVPRLTAAEATKMLRNGSISGGMIPKVETCIAAIQGETEAAHILDGRVPHVLLLEIFTEHGVGTMIKSK